MVFWKAPQLRQVTFRNVINWKKQTYALDLRVTRKAENWLKFCDEQLESDSEMFEKEKYEGK
jgi:hypothetical protein